MAKKILIVEDDKFLLNAYRVKLTKAGFDIKIATDGIEALEVLKDFRPDLILMDIVMPRQDGFVTLEKIKGDPNLKDIPVVVASSLGQAEDIEKGRKLGAKDYIVKSDISLEALVKKINTWTT